ncbi:MAG: VCBS repeat-containing protein [Bryobacteraceae bacterium]|nr:VCBS repeat-containing protein [Bryobacteraceae bacterium]
MGISRLSIACATLAISALAQPQFKEHVIATGLKGGYQVVPFDVNGDGRADLIALSSGLTELEWYENPGSFDKTWPRHVFAGGLSRMINVGVLDKDTLIVAHGFENVAAKSVGNVSVLRRPATAGAPWSVQEIDRLTTSHRLRSADIRGNGKPVMVNAPLTGAKAAPPDYNDNAPLVWYDPANGLRRELLNEANHGVVHGIFIVDWNKDKRDDILTASQSGIHIHSLGKNGKWTRTEFSAEPSSDIAVGKLGRERIVAAIEPWHGNRVTVYISGRRQIIDETLADGHTVITADLDGDGRDEIIAAGRQGPKSVFVYKNTSGTAWTRQTVDPAMPAAACIALDLNSDRRLDLACIAAGTANLKVYENLVTKPVSR